MSYPALPSIFFHLSLLFVYCHGRSHLISISSLLPSTSTECSSTSTASENYSNRLQIFHKKSLQSKDTAGSTTAAAKSVASTPTTLDLGEYAVTLGFGTPSKPLILSIDTGSDITWIQCKPCSRSKCYSQPDPIFDSSESSTYSVVTCNDPTCALLGSQCNSPTCPFYIHYGDGSISQGSLATETLTLTPSQELTNFQFGCAHVANGSFQGTDGIIGLSRSKISLASQAAQKYGNVFSYCLPSSADSTGSLTFGGPIPNSITKFTPMNPTFETYILNLTGLKVGEKTLSFPQSKFSAAIDSGTVFSYLPVPVYTALRDEFRNQMSKYPMVPSLGSLETCYNITGLNTIEVPGVEFIFAGGASLDVDYSGFMHPDRDQVCLSFFSKQGDIGVIGGTTQVTNDVVFDLGKGMVGFGAGGCK